MAKLALPYLKIALVLQNAVLALSYQQGRFATPKPLLASDSPLFRSSLSRNTYNPAPSFKTPTKTHFQNHVSQLNSMVTTNQEETVSSTANDDDSDEGGVGAWIPFASISSLTGLGPQRITVMNVDFVIWHTTPPSATKKSKDSTKNGESMKWTVQADACSHRLAPLSQGRVNPETNCIECPYHGWTFDSSGNVTSIPQLDKGRSIKDAQKIKGTNVKTFPSHAAGDLLFVFLPSSLHGEMFPQSILPEEFYPYLNDKKLENAEYFSRDLPYSFDFLVENFMDPAHIPFAHHKLQSTRDDGISIEMKEMESNFTHAKVSFRDMTRNRRRDAFASFQRPSFYQFSERKGDFTNEETGEREGDYELVLPIFVVPVKAGKSRLFLNTPKIKYFPKWLLHAGSNRFLNSDVWLHDTEREVIRRKEALPTESKKLCGLDYQYQSKSDLGVSVFRQWWRDNGMADSPPHTFGMATMDQLGPTALLRREQIDPWENHAKHCSVCRQTLANMKKLQTASLFLALLSVLFGSRKPLLGVAGATIGLLGHRFVKRFATVIEGNPEQSGIGDRSAAATAD